MTDVSDDGLSHLAGLKKLQRLNLHETIFGDPGMDHLAQLTNLESLHIGAVREITDVGLVKLSNLKKLKELNLIECFLITDEGIDKLRKTLPELRIKR